MELKTIQIIPENLFLIDDYETEANQEVLNAIVEAINANNNIESELEKSTIKKVSK